ncbi:hypothetical protein BO443_20312 [Burkholderia orbicola]
MRVGLNAIVVKGKGRTGGLVHQFAAFVFDDTARPYRLRALYDDSGHRVRHVERMRRVRKHRHGDVSAGLLQPLEVCGTGRRRVVIVVCPMEFADWPVDVGVVAITGHAVGIERQIGAKANTRRIPKAIESRHGGVERCLSTSRKAHQHDLVRIDAGIMRKQVTSLAARRVRCIFDIINIIDIFDCGSHILMSCSGYLQMSCLTAGMLDGSLSKGQLKPD